MYEKFFQLNKVPFGVTPDPSFLYMTQSHREALSGLMYAVLAKKGFVVLTGDAGTGKSTLLRALMRSSKSSRFSLILNPTLTLGDFLELVLLDFGIEDVPTSKAKRIMRLQEFFVKLREAGETPTLIVDEAHKLSPEILEEIRLLTNFETAERKLLQIILAGQTELRAVLNREDLRQLKQRIEIRLEVKPLSAADVRLYMAHRWERAGGGSEIPFTTGAIAAVAASSRGIPRLVNSICDNALLTAYGESSRVITGDHIRQVLRDLDIPDFSPATSFAKNGTPSPRANFESLKIATPAVHASVDFPTIERYCPEPAKPGIMRRLAARFSPALARNMRVSNE
jgi:general secretion pathway protein A